ncbi:MAG TPA: hypothetical protein EYP41_03960 [Anaerolineae bacterium]|nr:hypothetical protein [Anaerolineae bacterium]HIP70461.1 hypothetical protein [Anaerolineae bacterium]
MSEDLTKLVLESIPNQKSANELLGKLFDITKPEAIYSQPVTVGDVTVITASEYTAALGMGYGGGGGTSTELDEDETNAGYGGGGGGGGGTMGRPVAAIIIESGRARVEPIVDVTKLAIAFITALGAMGLALSRMRKFADTGELD